MDMSTQNQRDVIRTQNNKRRRGANSCYDHHPPAPPDLPHELVLENILSRLPAKTLVGWTCVCKLWRKSILFDRHFAFSHLFQTKKNPCLMFCFLNITPWLKDPDFDTKFRHRILTLTHNKRHLLGGQKYFCDVERELVGNCNGLICLLRRDDHAPEIVTPTRRHASFGLPINEGLIICYGFGFDYLTKEYKVVYIVQSTSTSTVVNEFKCFVLTWGTKSWRKTNTNSQPVPIPNQTPTKMPYSKSAIFCGGALFWKTSYDESMLLSFDLHDETFRVIRIPAECVVSKTTTTTTAQLPLVYLLEYKGSPCIARLVGGEHEEEYQQNSISGCKVHLHILKDKVKQLWANKESFDIPSSFYNATTITTNVIRMVSFSDQVLVCWYDRILEIKLYNLHTEDLKTVTRSRSNDGYLMFNTALPPEFRHIDFQVINTHVENLLTLTPFYPKKRSKRCCSGCYSDTKWNA